jgi:hypothetical protein
MKKLISKIVFTAALMASTAYAKRFNSEEPSAKG